LNIEITGSCRPTKAIVNSAPVPELLELLVEPQELLFNGEVVKNFPVGDGRDAEFRKRIEANRGGWFALRALIDGPVPPVDDTNLRPETAAI